jgi:hypothetical protein
MLNQLLRLASPANLKHWPIRCLAALAIVFSLGDFALAANKREEALRLLVAVTLIPLAIYPLGLAVHLFLVSLAPQRSAELALDLREHRWKTFFLGLCNGFALFILLAVLGERFPLLAGVVFLASLAILLGALHGLARGLGEWVCERAELGKITAWKSLAIGWFVTLFISAIPIAGWIWGAYWLTRGIGAVILQISGRRSPDSPSRTLE